MDLILAQHVKVDGKKKPEILQSQDVVRFHIQNAKIATSLHHVSTVHGQMFPAQHINREESQIGTAICARAVIQHNTDVKTAIMAVVPIVRPAPVLGPVMPAATPVYLVAMLQVAVIPAGHTHIYQSVIGVKCY